MGVFYCVNLSSLKIRVWHCIPERGCFTNLLDGVEELRREFLLASRLVELREIKRHEISPVQLVFGFGELVISRQTRGTS